MKICLISKCVGIFSVLFQKKLICDLIVCKVYFLTKLLYMYSDLPHNIVIALNVVLTSFEAPA